MRETFCGLRKRKSTFFLAEVWGAPDLEELVWDEAQPVIPIDTRAAAKDQRFEESFINLIGIAIWKGGSFRTSHSGKFLDG
jgi:hypothetical protein